MRHGVKLNHLGRTSAHRKALLSKLACDLILHKRIITTLAKAKTLRVYVEPLLTKSKENTTHQRRVVFSYLEDKEAVKELFSIVSEKIASRPGGYTRIIKLGARLGDAAEMAMIELVDFNEIYTNQAADSGKKKRTRRSSGAKKKTEESVTEESKEAVSTEEATEDKENTEPDKNEKGKEPEA
ncbi:MAG: 50S ribosomal protein L17 [Chitinophagaceae bacterium]